MWTLCFGAQIPMACFCGLADRVTFGFGRSAITHRKNWMAQRRQGGGMYLAAVSNQSVAVKSQLLMRFWLSLLMHLASFMSIWHNSHTNSRVGIQHKRNWKFIDLQGRPYLLAGRKQSNFWRCMHPSEIFFWVKYSYDNSLLWHITIFQQNLPHSMKFCKMP